MESKINTVKSHKIESAKNHEKIKSFRRRYLNKAKQSTNEVKRQREIGRMKLVEMKAATMYRAKREYDERLKSESDLRKMEEKKLKRLERKERKLMERLARETSIRLDDESLLDNLDEPMA